MAGEIARFAGVGLAGFALDYAVLAGMLAVGASPYAGRVPALAASIVLTWVLNRRLTFRTPTPPSWREFGAYALQSLAGAVLNYAVYSAALWAGAPVLAALVLGTGVAAAFNFVKYRALLSTSSPRRRGPITTKFRDDGSPPSRG